MFYEYWIYVGNIEIGYFIDNFIFSWLKYYIYVWWFEYEIFFIIIILYEYDFFI